LRHYTSTVHAVALCLSICLSVRHNSVFYQIAKRWITETKHSDSSFLITKILMQFEWSHS